MLFEKSIFASESTLNILQNIFKYAPPIFVGIETIQICRAECSRKWYDVLLTTRILIAHCSIADKNREHYLSIVANNIRNLYRLFDIDLATKDGWTDVNDDTCYYAIPSDVDKKWVSLKDNTPLVTNLESISFEYMKVEFDTDINSAQNAFGCCVYNLVATRDNMWKTQFPKNYRNLTVDG